LFGYFLNNSYCATFENADAENKNTSLFNLLFFIYASISSIKLVFVNESVPNLKLCLTQLRPFKSACYYI